MFRQSSSYSSKPIKSIKVAYIVALTLIAAMSVGVHYFVVQVANDSEYSASTINTAAKQRMLSQRTAYLLFKANQTGLETDRQSFKDALSQFKANHEGLTKGNSNLRLTGKFPEEVRKIYFEGDAPLDATMSSHIAALEGFNSRLETGERIPASDLQPYLTTAETSLLNRLNDVVEATEFNAEDKIHFLVEVQRYSIIAILVALLAEALFIFRPLVSSLQKYISKIEYAAGHDSLTDLPNRRTFYDLGERELSRCRRHSLKLSMLLCDLDNFKSINDRYGHKVGDDALKYFSKTTSAILRKEDVIARIGGEEFAIFLPQTDKNHAQVVAEKIRKETENISMKIDNGETVTFTTSIGITDIYGSARNQSVDDLLMRADEALYRAKENGRNRFEVTDALLSLSEKQQKVA